MNFEFANIDVVQMKLTGIVMLALGILLSLLLSLSNKKGG